MATTPKAAGLTRLIDHDLWEIEAEAEFLPELAAGWFDEGESQRYVWYQEWRNLLDGLKKLDQQYRSGAMTTEQQERYRTLCRTLRKAVPLFRQLDLPLPPASLDG